MKDLERLKRGTVDFVSPEGLAEKLNAGRPLRAKLGVDPTTPDLHVGHTVVLQKLRQFQDLGHTAVLIIGDFTTRVGDPSGRDSTRPSLSVEQIEANARTYKEQAFKILDPAKTEVVHNSDWLDSFMKGELLKTMQRYTVGQLLARDDFQKRMKANSPITLLEILYPLLQGYDSVAVKADVELGGTDQLFNLLMGRTMQKDAGQAPQIVMTLPLLVGLDGAKKMSKSYGNHIGISEPAREVFGKVMKISDEQMMDWYELLTGEDLETVKTRHPMEAKKNLAELLTRRFHGEDAGRAERLFFEETFSNKKAPENVESWGVDSGLMSSYLSVLIQRKAEMSRKEAGRLIAQGGVSLNGEKVSQDDFVFKLLPKRIEKGTVVSLKLGKHKFYNLTWEDAWECPEK
jgi:tyrosyl-tRNA synthetase